MRHSVARVLPYTPDQLFDLVGDVKHYPDFVPWVTSLRTWNEQPEEEGVSHLDAEAAVGFSFLREKFSTHVRRDRSNHQVDVSLISGPFKKLRNRWRFVPHEHGTKVLFDIDFEFRMRFLDGILAANFDQAVSRLIGCFDARARTLYGTASGVV
ncbi:type II toxin-antitoxin system RatA family toxin [Caulobacter sp. NIBR2454]|uniref:type II toxin-antitoxin system RatA family toxin n=1 Tax=Caulobacter sp. NIBR2454 TaxID=3015996 RepID=UPI0022B6AC59|nr:SRPBCC family protein [Caulobacter sp. NIBR2454]